MRTERSKSASRVVELDCAGAASVLGCSRRSLAAACWLRVHSLALATPAGCVSGAGRPGASRAARTPHELAGERQRAVPLERSEGAAAGSVLALTESVAS
jgi:hypothetical protein